MRWATYEEQQFNINRKSNSNSGKQVCQCNLDGTIIKIWKNITHASKKLGISSTGIENCCNQRFKISGDFK